MGKVGAEQAGSSIWGALSPLGRRSERRQRVQRSRVGRHWCESRQGRQARKEAGSASGKWVMWRGGPPQPKFRWLRSPPSRWAPSLPREPVDSEGMA